MVGSAKTAFTGNVPESSDSHEHTEITVNILAVIETAIYVDDLDRAEAFYRGILGLPVTAKVPGRHVFFQVGSSSVLLAFIAETTLKEKRTLTEPEGRGILR